MNFLERKNNSSLYQRAALTYIMAHGVPEGFGDIQQAFDFADGFIQEYTRRTSSPQDAKVTRRFARWTQKEEVHLEELFRSGLPIAKIALKMDRTYSAIQSRLIKMDLIPNPYNNKP